MFVRLLRPHQWIKNGFVLLGVLFSHQWHQSMLLLSAVMAFMTFCVIASAVYILNDILDVEADRQHPLKCKRPIASGVISISSAWSLFVVLAALALGIAAWVGPWVFGFIAIYVLLNLAYSWRLKHIPILDVFIISAGFMLRILTGTVGIGIEPSQWLLLTGLMLTLFLGFTKRHAELSMLDNLGKPNDVSIRKVLDDYSPVMLEQSISITAACTILSYGLYTVSAETIAAHETKHLFYTLPFVIYGIFRYLFLIHKRACGTDTAWDILTDKHLLLVVVIWLAVTLGLLS